MKRKNPTSSSLLTIQNQINELLERANALQQNTPSGDMDLEKRILFAYKNRVLQDLDIIFNKDSLEQLFGAIRAYLKKNWYFTLTDRREGSILSYTALPEDELTNLLADLAIFVKENDINTDENECALSILMPTISLDSLSNDKAYPDLRMLDVKEVIKTHIIGREGKYLIPVRQFIELQHSPTYKWINKYFDYKIHDSYLALLSYEEYERLANHSSYTKAVSEAKKNYEICLQKQDSLFFHLQELCRHLSFNSNYVIGTETVPGMGAYQAIINFNDYYKKLDIETKHKIPKEVQSRIELLLCVSSDKKTNLETETNNICIGTRRNRLNSSINVEESALRAIGLADSSFQHTVEEKKQYWIDCERSFEKALNQNILHGSEQLGVTIDLIKVLEVDYEISSMSDLHILLKLSSNEFTFLCQNTNIKQKIISLFSKKDFHYFIHTTSLSTLESLLSNCGEALVNKLFVDKDDDFETDTLSTLLMSLNAERCKLVYVLTIDSFIKTCYDFSSLLFNLSSEQRTIIYESAHPKLFQLIKRGTDFQNVTEYLSLEKRTHVFDNIKDKIFELDIDGFNFYYLLKNLSSEQRAIIIEITKTRLPDIITQYSHFQNLDILSSEQFTIVYETIKFKLFELTNSADKVNHLLSCLSTEQRELAFTALKEKLPKMINNANDLQYVLKYLNKPQRIFVLEAVKETLLEIIKSNESFTKINSLFLPERCNVLYEVLEINVVEIINHNYKIIPLLKSFSDDEFAKICESVKLKLIERIKNAKDCKNILEPFSDEKSDIMCETIKEKLPEVIHNLDDFAQLMPATAQSSRFIVFETIKPNLTEIIRNSHNWDGDRYLSLMKYLSSGQRIEMHDAMQIVEKQKKSSWWNLGISLFSKTVGLITGEYQNPLDILEQKNTAEFKSWSSWR